VREVRRCLQGNLRVGLDADLREARVADRQADGVGVRVRGSDERSLVPAVADRAQGAHAHDRAGAAAAGANDVDDVAVIVRGPCDDRLLRPGRAGQHVELPALALHEPREVVFAAVRQDQRRRAAQEVHGPLDPAAGVLGEQPA